LPSAGIATTCELRYLTGTGVSAAAIFHVREQLDRAGYDKVRIVASSGFDVQKCKVMAGVGAPIDVRSHRLLPARQLARDICHCGRRRVRWRGDVKIGREFLTKRKRAANGDGQSL
jgi:nicotinate phosphoribosyltransferase